jgi:methionyl-tRNA formyltransferase
VSREPVRIAYVGLPLGALLLAQDGLELVWVGLPRRDSLGTRRARRVFGERLAIAPKLDGATLAAVRAAGANYLVSWFWTKRVPPGWLRAFGPCTLGVHPSLLPRHRGPDPIFWAIDVGDRETGVSAHRLEDAYDVGDVLAQRTIPIDDRVDGWRLAKRLDRPSLGLLRELMARASRGEDLPAIAQDEALATEAPSLEEEELAIVWSWDAQRILLRIRAAAPWPGAWTEIGESVVSIERAALCERVPRALRPGEAWVEEGRVFVCAGQGAVELLRVRLDDDRVLAGPALASLVAGAEAR